MKDGKCVSWIQEIQTDTDLKEAYKQITDYA